MVLLFVLVGAGCLLFGMYEGFLFLESSVLVLGVLLYAPFEALKDLCNWLDRRRKRKEPEEEEVDENGIPYL